MISTSTDTAAAVPSRTLSTPASPLAVDTWRDRMVGTGVGLAVPTGMRHPSAFRITAPDHNSIAPKTPAVRAASVAPANTAPVNTGSGAYGAAKQAAPPRGVPR